MVQAKPWYVYIVQCSDGSFYTGITTDIKRRVKEHNSAKGCNYTRSRAPVELLYEEPAADRRSALKREASIKSFSRSRKEELVNYKCPTKRL